MKKAMPETMKMTSSIGDPAPGVQSSSAGSWGGLSATRPFVFNAGAGATA